MTLNSGIYTITSPSGKMYVGSAKDFDYRWSKHSYDLRKGVHHCKLLQSASNKYGFSNLVFKRLLVCELKDLLFYEQRAIDILKPEYNIAKIAGSNLGIKHSPETIQRMKDSRTLEVRTRISNAHKGKPKSEIHKKNLSAGISRTMGTPEARLRNSIAQKIAQNIPAVKQANSETQKIAQMRPEVRAKKGRALICVENSLRFTNGHEAAEWCYLAGLTTNINAFVAINSAVRSGKPIYGFHWKATIKEETNE
jgi:group I intron endonuclease